MRQNGTKEAEQQVSGMQEEYQASKMEDTHQRNQRKTPEPKVIWKIHSKDINLKIYTKQSKGWPKDITIIQLVIGIEEGTYKYT